MPIREIKVRETPDFLEVDFFPGTAVKVVAADRSPPKAPDVKVDVGEIGGKKVPLRARYPRTYTVDDIMARTDTLFAKADHCTDCERKRAAIMQRVRDVLGDRVADIERSFATPAPPAPVAAPSIAPPPTAPAPAPAAPPRAAPAPATPPPADLPRLEDRMRANVTDAILETRRTVAQLLVPPVLPSWHDILSRARGGRQPPGV